MKSPSDCSEVTLTPYRSAAPPTSRMESFPALVKKYLHIETVRPNHLTTFVHVMPRAQIKHRIRVDSLRNAIELTVYREHYATDILLLLLWEGRSPSDHQHLRRKNKFNRIRWIRIVSHWSEWCFCLMGPSAGYPSWRADHLWSSHMLWWCLPPRTLDQGRLYCDIYGRFLGSGRWL